MPDTGRKTIGWSRRARWWGHTATALLLALIVAVQPGAASPAHAATTHTAVFEFDLPEGLDRAKAAAWMAELNDRNPLLSDSLREEVDSDDLDLPGGTADVPWPDFDGQLALTATGLTVTIVSDVATSDVGYLATLGALAAGAAIGYFVRFACSAAMAYFFAIPWQPSQVICSPLGVFLGTFTTQAILIKLNGQERDWQKWLEALGNSLVAAIGPGVWEKYLGPWVRDHGVEMMQGIATALRTAANGLRWFGRAVGDIATDVGNWIYDNAADAVAAIRRGAARGGAQRPELRVMPLGDSITAGVESSNNNGYRDELHDAMSHVWGDDRVTFVGSQSTGTMAENHHEGYPGKRIDEIADLVECSVPQSKPNVVTVHAGTNDANQNFALSSAPARLRELIDQVLTDSPRAVVVVARLLPTGKAGLQPRIDDINRALAGMVADLQAQDKHVLLVDTSDIKVSEGLQNDSHPDDGGYAKLGYDFFRGILTADGKGWLQTAEVTPGTCLRDNPTSPTPTSPATALGDGWSRLGVIVPGFEGASYQPVFAELNGDNRADYLQLYPDGSFRASINTVGQPGFPEWVDAGTYDPTVDAGLDGATVNAEEVRFADLNGDGRDDLLAVGASNSLTRAFLNLPGTGGRLRFTYWGTVFDDVSFSRDNLRLADVTGDGYDDILRVGTTGTVHAYINVPSPNDPFTPPTWREKLNWAPGATGASLFNLRFADVDNDNKADYLTVGSNGNVHAYLNKGGKDAGGFEAHLNFANESNYPGELVQFKDISGDGKADYLVVYNQGAVRAWLNRGGNLASTPTALGAGWSRLGVIAPGMPRPAAYARTEIAEMNGDKRADYVQIRKDGSIRVGINTEDQPGQPTWLPWGGGTGEFVPTGQRSDPADTGFADSARLVDIDGDGRDDFVLLSPSGEMEVFYNRLLQAGGLPGFVHQAGNIAPVNDVARADIRFADINGDGRDDYLRVGTAGQVHAYVNTGLASDSPKPVWVEKLNWAPGATGASRNNLRFADVDNDNKADYLTVGSNGNVHAYLNRGGKDAGGFEAHLNFANESNYPGELVQFKDISGDGKADYLVVYHQGAVRAWLNRGGNL
ncbi:FG-GAP-like repeat-containing protein [Micromonospora sp. DH14]|uniref:FG-GAP-like repeat-containing protein n=1 Tax=Micromonospora sp. DH14 TaxID=3040120 RepID=UPI002441B9BA|nr:FG-GAP-like repeat-containing protein [Micromonospora sp. DH14]MDG9674096.1 FG-GAP-like repeat-containing protein [Micromonospora sp. DH14]